MPSASCNAIIESLTEISIHHSQSFKNTKVSITIERQNTVEVITNLFHIQQLLGLLDW